MKKHQPFTDAERIQRIWEKENLKDIMSRRAYMNSGDQRRRELDELWVREPEHRETASLGRNWGYYVGMNAISEYYVVKHDDDRRAALENTLMACPELREHSPAPGLGCMTMHTISTPMIELSGDGKTARGLWFSVGQETVRSGKEASALWHYGPVAVDFIKESGQWKIWHLYLGTDFSVEAGTDYADIPVYLEPGLDPVENEFGEPDIHEKLHDPMFNWWDNYPPRPEPYYEFSPSESYGPAGHPDYLKWRGKYE